MHSLSLVGMQQGLTLQGEKNVVWRNYREERPMITDTQNKAHKFLAVADDSCSVAVLLGTIGVLEVTKTGHRHFQL